MTIWDKAVDNWGDWQAAQHIAKKYDDEFRCGNDSVP